MKQLDCIFTGIKDYLLTLDKNSWKWHQILQGINILQDETLHIFVVGTENYGQAETLKLLAPSQKPPRTASYNYEPFKPQIYYKDAHLCLWKLSGLGRLDCEHEYLVKSIIPIIRDSISSNLFIILVIFNTKRFGLSYEEDFIKQLRAESICNCSDIDSHMVFALNMPNKTEQDICNSFISETEKSLYSNLLLDSKITPYCPDNEQSCMDLKAKLLIRSAALYHRYA